MFLDLPIRRSRYAPGRLVSPAGEALVWTPEYQDGQGNAAASLTCDDVVEVRFIRPAGGDRFLLSLRSRLVDGEGTEWSIAVPGHRFGILSLPVGFAAEQSLMGAVYRLPEPRRVRIRVEQRLELPGLNFLVELVN
ncbi:MAG: hypothetical protein DIU70_011350 [Bacillota bacterium]|nr:MAG: hypothetical protein DIU70_04740 [Bacillota bacterium]